MWRDELIHLVSIIHALVPCVAPEPAEKSGYVLPNLSVIYGFGFLDLRQETLVLTLLGSSGLNGTHG
jgi:hypothetical protein